ncbi:hypothetical protein LCGC14_1424140 [marine sediment metagenome]|uniref:Uncharacterized protein n=1 Tax=marine sediment metagenome TaxID=412755 RepID=A0A0F9JQW8_9ZZZZ
MRLRATLNPALAAQYLDIQRPNEDDNTTVERIIRAQHATMVREHKLRLKGTSGLRDVAHTYWFWEQQRQDYESHTGRGFDD